MPTEQSSISFPANNNLPIIGRFPTEIFGYSFINKTEEAKSAIENQYCPFINSECNKPRKSEPQIKVGVCSVGYKGSFMKKYEPVIICPNRLIDKAIYTKIEQDFFQDDLEAIVWTTEVNLGVGGSVDYAAIKLNPDGGIEKFVFVEFQAGGTTGTPWEAVLEFKELGYFKSNKYPYGINWANEFSKTMMQQVYKKGKIIQSLKSKIIFVVQDLGLEYIKSVCDISDLRKANNDDPIYFYSFSLFWDGNSSWKIKFREKLSTNVDGIIKIIGGAEAEKYLSLTELKLNLLKRLKLTNFKV
ncbi:MAG: hypothetical protein GY861_25645 [bacterium]|nr:hypothetical protein [bacterium]